MLPSRGKILANIWFSDYIAALTLEESRDQPLELHGHTD